MIKKRYYMQNRAVEDICEQKRLETPKDPNRKKREPTIHTKITKEDFGIFKNVKILVAEDNVINQKVITSLLGNSGIDITIANDGREVLDILENEKDFSVIFMDVHMPTLDGFQAAMLIRKDKGLDHIPIIALSGDTASDDIKNMLSAGMDAHLEKPMKMDALYDTLYIYTTGKEGRLNAHRSDRETTCKLDVDKGLEICGGDNDFYIEILNDFLSKYSNSDKTLKEHINGTNGIDAAKLLLDISGVAANIGANKLHDIALELKASIADPQDMAYISGLKEYGRILAKVCESIKGYIKTSAA